MLRARSTAVWRGGLLHRVSGVSYWTLRAGIVGHLRPYATTGVYRPFFSQIAVQNVTREIPLSAMGSRRSFPWRKRQREQDSIGWADTGGGKDRLILLY